MQTLIIFLIVLSILVFVHEFGHFIVARIFGVKVEEFGFGFPPRMIGIKKKDTIYSINWIPLGGFVKLKGEEGDHAQDHDSFISKKVWQRGIIVAAGVIMNFVLAAIIFSAGLMYGLPHNLEGLPGSAQVRDASIVVGQVLKDSPAEKVGFEYGDKVVSIDGKAFDKIEGIQEYVKTNSKNEMLWSVKRGNNSLDFSATPILIEQTGTHGIGVGLVGVGIVSYPWYLASVKGVELTVFLARDILFAFGHVISGLVTQGHLTVELAGPVGIAVLTGEVAALGILSLLQFIAVLSINLAIINFLPFPALDGGRFLFLIIEKFRGKPVGRRLEAIIHQIGFALLLLVVLIVTYRDLVKFSDAIIGGFKNLF